MTQSSAIDSTCRLSWQGTCYLQSALEVRLYLLQNLGALTDPLWCPLNKEEVRNFAVILKFLNLLTIYTSQAMRMMCSHMQSPCPSPPPNIMVMRVVHTMKPISSSC